MTYDGKSEMVQEFLFLVGGLTDAIDRMCAVRTEGAPQNHSMDAVESLLGAPQQEFGPLDHLLGFRLQEHVRLFGRMTLVKAAAREFGTPHLVDEYLAAPSKATA